MQKPSQACQKKYKQSQNRQSNEMKNIKKSNLTTPVPGTSLSTAGFYWCLVPH